MTIHPRFELENIREATNKAWALGNDRFKVTIEQLINRQIQAKPRGGNRKSEIFKKKVTSIESDPLIYVVVIFA